MLRKLTVEDLRRDYILVWDGIRICDVRFTEDTLSEHNWLIASGNLIGLAGLSILRKQGWRVYAPKIQMSLTTSL